MGRCALRVLIGVNNRTFAGPASSISSTGALSIPYGSTAAAAAGPISVAPSARTLRPLVALLLSAHAVHREIVEASEDVARGPNGDLIRGRVRDKWTAVACGKATTL